MTTGRHMLALVKRDIFPNSSVPITEVIDSDRRVDINVNNSDRELAKAGDFRNCAMAIAVCRNGWDEAFIMTSISYLRKGNTVMRFLTPVSVAKEITSLDRGADFFTGAYHLAPMSPSRRQGASPKNKTGSGNGKRKFGPGKHITGGVRTMD